MLLLFFNISTQSFAASSKINLKDNYTNQERHYEEITITSNKKSNINDSIIHIDDTLYIDFKSPYNNGDYAFSLSQKVENINNAEWEIIQDFTTDTIRYEAKQFGTVELKITIQDVKTKNILKTIDLGSFEIATFRNFEELPKTFKNYIYSQQLPMHQKQLGAILFLYLIGFIILIRFKKTLKIHYICILSFIIGSVIWALTSILVLTFSIPYTLITMLVIIGILLILPYFIILNDKKSLIPNINFSVKPIKSINFSKKEMLTAFIYTIAFVLISGFFVYINYALFSYDSYYYLAFGKELAFYGGFKDFMLEQIRAFGMFMPTFHSLAGFFGYDFSYAVHPLMSFIFLVLFYFLTYDELISLQVSKKDSIFYALLGVLILGSCYFWIYQSFWIMNNVFTAIFLTLGLIFAWRARRTQSSLFLFLSYISMLTFAFARVESPLYSVLFIALITGLNFPYEWLKRYILSYSLFIIIWYINLFSFKDIGVYSDFFSVGKGIAILSCYLLLILYIYLFNQKWIQWLRQYLYPIITGLLIIGILGAIILKPTFAINNFHMLIQNLFYPMLWGYTFIIIAGMAMISLFMKNYKYKEFVSTCIYGYLFLLIIIFMFRKYPLRAGYGDSGNRMLTHILPLIVFNFMLIFANYKNSFNKKTT